ncbi:MAG: hypothetical protein JXK05_07320 [Campylobacterales bacterium]|nr:hypothetical protein [Campylobacterales bacterium]
MRFLVLFLWLHVALLALEFSLVKKETNTSEPTLLVVGGIQGDEPGGFNAAAILAMRYAIRSGNVWIVPNLNFESIIERSRGGYGDMNRKFAHLDPSDPDYEIVRRIQSVITDEQVDLVVNLHDGSGYYRAAYIDEGHNPQRWGQSCIIDQSAITAKAYGNLEQVAAYVVDEVNKKLVDEEHRYHLRNTKTAEGDTEMAKTLTYFAINHNKAAFGNEGSKEFATHFRVYYHLAALEAYMRYMGIDFSRDFALTPEGVKAVIDTPHPVTLFEKFTLPAASLRPVLRYVPIDRAKKPFESPHPLICLVPQSNAYRLFYGNNRLSTIVPEYFESDDSLHTFGMRIDGAARQVQAGEIVEVKEHFSVDPIEGYRVNVIGYTHPKGIETGVTLTRKALPERFSIDIEGRIYRIEIYKGERFSAMALVRFVR